MQYKELIYNIQNLTKTSVSQTKIAEILGCSVQKINKRAVRNSSFNSDEIKLLENAFKIELSKKSTIGSRLKQIRNILNLEPDDFGRKIGMSGAEIAKIEDNKSSINNDIMYHLLKEYNINLNWLIGGDDEGEMFNKKPVKFEQAEDEFEAKVEAVLKKKGIIL